MRSNRLRQCIQDVDVWLNHHWLLRYPLKCAEETTQKQMLIIVVINGLEWNNMSHTITMSGADTKVVLFGSVFQSLTS